MRLFYKQLSFLALILIIVVFLFTICRFLFYFYNQDLFGNYQTGQIMSAIINGIVYDALTVVFVNLLFIFLYLWPARIYNSIFHNALIKIVFFLSNTSAILLNLIDFGVYKQYNHRLNAYSFKSDLSGFFEQFDIVDLRELGKNHLSLIVYALIFIVAIWFSRRLVRRYYYERKKYRTFRGWFSFGFFIVLIGMLIWSGFNDKEWLKDLYLKSNRELSSLTLNNPYLLWRTYNSEKDIWDIDWHISNQGINGACTNSRVYNFKKINIIVVRTESGKIKVNNNHAKYNYQINGFKSSQKDLFKLLDEILLSCPSVFETGIYKTVYSFNKFESLVEFLWNKSYKCDLSMDGFDEEEIENVRNFYGFSNNQDSLIDISGKHFRLFYLQNDTKIDSVLKSNKNSSLNIIACMNADSIEKKDDTLNEKVFIYSSEKLPFVDSLTYFAQFLDIKPTIECLLGGNNESISFGKNLFSESNHIFQTNSNDDGKILIDSLLLVIEDSETVKMQKRKGRKFEDFDFKDSLAVERIILENKYHSLVNDYKKRLMSDKLMSD